MKKSQFIFLLLFVMSSLCFAQKKNKPVVIITQDGEVDDRSSFVRFLLYTPDIRIFTLFWKFQMKAILF